MSFHLLLRDSRRKRYAERRIPPPASLAERLNSRFATDTERRRALVSGIGEQCRDVLAIIPRAERFAESRQEHLVTHAFSPRIGFGSRAAELSRADDLPQKQGLKSNAKV